MTSCYLGRGISETESPQFEVASVKRTAACELGGVYTYPGGRMAFRGCTFAYLVQTAFDLQEFQIGGAIDWMRYEHYDIDATVPATAKSSHLSPPYSKAPMTEEQRGMLQSLLVERFGLKYRRETRNAPVYLLVQNGKPLKLADAKDKSAYPWSGGLAGGRLAEDGLAGINESMSDLAIRLSRYMGRPVLDRTALSGSFDFRVEYSSGDERPDVIDMIIVCLQNLGLKLKAANGLVESIVIEHAERPSAN